jgi:release factor glutamine methyltransferase
LELYLKFDRPLKEYEINKYRDSIARRGKNEPLQYIIGKVEFYGFEFKVTADVLIPRPETEILVEETANYCMSKTNIRVLDIGTGSGNIAIVLAKKYEVAGITSIDISENAIAIAKENALLNGLDSNIEFVKADSNIFTPERKFDVIVSNPPYVSINEYNSLQNEIKYYEPSIAVTDSGDGFTFYRTIAGRAGLLLNSGGRIFFEVGKDQSGIVEEILKENNFHTISIVKDYQQINRVITGVFL